MKDLIINKSLFQFLNRGYKGCTLKDLEKTTGLTKGAFYYYFRNKKAILKAGLEKYFASIREIPASEVKSLDSLKEYLDLVVARKEENARRLRDVFDFFIIEASLFKLVLDTGECFPKFRQHIDRLSQRRLSAWEYVLNKAREKGEIRSDVDIEILARNLLSVSTSMLNIELGTANMRFVFSDMKMQFEQYYQLIRK